MSPLYHKWCDLSSPVGQFLGSFCKFFSLSHVSHYIYYRHICQPQSSKNPKIVKVFLDRRNLLLSKDLRRGGGGRLLTIEDNNPRWWVDTAPANRSDSQAIEVEGKAPHR